jgi:AraC family transcriptional regulator of adaptative response / DNA-3-methyladenine glycosylase II
MLDDRMDLDRDACDRARRARDARFDGRFFIGVTSTRIYCRPICPARAPKDENIRYFATAAAAEAEGFRPCLRCRPESSPGTPAWVGTSALVSRALRLIAEGALDAGDVETLASRVGVTGRHLRRLFLEHLGATPLGVALTRRAHFAKKLLDETELGMADIAAASGFGSVRRFNTHMRRTYARTPTEIRRLARRRAEAGTERYRMRLAYRPPYDWPAMLAFLAARATSGVEAVDGGRYRRTIAVNGQTGFFSVSHAPEGHALALEIRFADPSALLPIVERVRRLFDLGADPAVIAAHLGSDPLLAPVLARHPGMRTPGAWDGFEVAVRAVLGQQVSVRAATTLAGRIVSAFGAPVELDHGLTRLFPVPARLAAAPLETVGIIRTRANTIRALARQVADGSLSFQACGHPSRIAAALDEIPGIGRWTAEYIAMRAFGEPDAFLTGDLVLRRIAGDCTARVLDATAEAWRPWRAYAVMLMWQLANDRVAESRDPTHAKATRRSTRPGRAADDRRGDAAPSAG